MNQRRPVKSCGAVAVVAVAAVLLLAACGSDPAADLSNGPESTEIEPSGVGQSPTGGVDGPMIFAAPTDSGEESLMTGAQLALVDDCLGLTNANGFVVVVWPFGSTWDEGSSSLTLGDEDETEFLLGDRMDLGGGPVNEPFPESLGAEALTALERCAALAYTEPFVGWAATSAENED